jgi:hypothetical protein
MIYSLSPPQYRNFEVNGSGQSYKVVTAAPYLYNNVVYTQGQTITFDSGSSYSNPAQLERDFNRGWLDPAD